MELNKIYSKEKIESYFVKQNFEENLVLIKTSKNNFFIKKLFFNEPFSKTIV